MSSIFSCLICGLSSTRRTLNLEHHQKWHPCLRGVSILLPSTNRSLDIQSILKCLQRGLKLADPVVNFGGGSLDDSKSIRQVAEVVLELENVSRAIQDTVEVEDLPPPNPPLHVVYIILLPHLQPS